MAVAVVGSVAMGITPALTVPAAFGLAGGIYAATRTLYQGLARSKQRALERLADRLVEHIEEVAE